MNNPARLLLVASLFVLCGCGKADSTGGDPDAGEDASTEPEYLQAGDPVHGLDITAVAIYQGVKIPLMEDWEEAGDYPVPLVQGREAMVRVYVQRQSQWQPHDIIAQVDVESDLVETEPLQWFSSVEIDSAEYNIDSTLNISVPASYLTADARITVSLREWSGGVLPKGTADNSIWPAEGSYDLGAQDTGIPLKLVLIPVRYWADGSGRSPDTSPQQIQRYVEAMYAQYPTRGVEVTVRDPIDWDQPITYDGGGWVEVLSEIMGIRASSGAQTEEYYYGLFQPAATFGEYCIASCVMGMSNLAEHPNDAWARASVGLGFSGQESADTMVHEVGHAHGREHSPCGVGGYTDPYYPYAGASIGTWGYDMEKEELKDPVLYYDFMSYCSPTWVSDYTYNALYNRIIAVNALASKKGPGNPPSAWRSLMIDIDGSVARGPVFWLDTPPIGRARSLDLLDSSGQLVESITARFQPFSYAPAGLVVFREPAADVAFARLPDGDPVPLAP